jgi:hypothetical protein
VQQTFFVGIGAQKAGTTWLYEYINSHPDCRLSSMKEMNYFNSFKKGEFEIRRRRVERRRKFAYSFGWKQALYWTGLKRYHGYTVREHLALLDDFEALLAKDDLDAQAYAAMLLQHAGNARIFGEVTPGYSQLPKDELANLYGAFPKTRMIYLMRDPVERLWSNAKMRSRNHRNTDTRSAKDVMASMSSRDIPGATGRSDYRSAILNLDAVAPADHVHYEFFETLFSKDGAESARNRICDFLEISQFHPASVERVKNPGQSLPLPDDLAKEALSWLRPQYEYIRDRFGGLPAAWEETLAKYG